MLRDFASITPGTARSSRFHFIFCLILFCWGLTDEEEHGSGGSGGGALAGHRKHFRHDDPEDAGVADGEAEQEDAHGEEGQGGSVVGVRCCQQDHAPCAYEAAAYEQRPAPGSVDQRDRRKDARQLHLQKNFRHPSKSNVTLQSA